MDLIMAINSKRSGSYVRKVREQLGLTQVQFGKRLGLGRHTIMRYERGGPLPQHARLAIDALLEKRK